MSASNNGSNPRLDRIEKLIQESERANKEAHARIDARIDKSQARSEKSQAEFEKRMARSDTRMDRFESDMRRWAALGVQEARRHRRRMQEIDKKIDQLASSHILTEEAHRRTEEAQRRTEETLQRFISSMKRGRNGDQRGRG